MRPIRTIPSESFPFDVTHTYQDEYCFAVRLLNVIEPSALVDNVEIQSISALYTSNQLASRNIEICLADSTQKVYKHNGKLYYIAAECIFDRRDPQWSRTWAPSANIIFAINMRGDKTLRVYEKGLMTAMSKWRSNFYAQHEGLVVPAQLYVRSPQDPVNVVCKSIVAKPNGFMGNVSFKDSVSMDPDTVNASAQSSHFLQLTYKLYGPKTVKPDQAFEVSVVAYDGEGKKIASEVNYDGFVIEAVDGYIPHRRCKLVNGMGKFKVIALGLEDGEEIRVKFGRKYGTGLGEWTGLVKN